MGQMPEKAYTVLPIELPQDYCEPPADVVVVIKSIGDENPSIEGFSYCGVRTNRRPEESNEALAERTAASLKELLLDKLNELSSKEKIDPEKFFATRDVGDIMQEFIDQ